MDSTLNIKSISVLDFLPQRPPFVFIDHLLQVDEGYGKSQFEVKCDNVLIENECLMAGGLIENMAQTAAAVNGYYQFIEQLPVLRGYIGAISRVNIYDLPKIGATIFTEMKLKTKVMNVQIVETQIVDTFGNALADCELKIFLEE